MPKPRKEKERTIPKTVTLYPSTVQIVEGAMPQYGHKYFSSMVDFIINDWANTQSQSKRSK